MLAGCGTYVGETRGGIPATTRQYLGLQQTVSRQSELPGNGLPHDFLLWSGRGAV